VSPENILRLARTLLNQRISIPEQSLGTVRIEHEIRPAGSTIAVTNFREAMFAGLPMLDLELKKDLIIHHLISEEYGDWMSDQPCELIQMHRDLACHARGRVLIGGLGLGILPRMLQETDRTDSITVVERDPDVVKLIGPYLNGRVTVINADIFEYVKTIKKRQYDCALLDTWQSTGEWPWQTEVVPLRRALRPLCRKVYCWAEATMIGQVAKGLMVAADIKSEQLKSQGTCHYYAFRRALIDESLRDESNGIDRSDLMARISSEMKNMKDDVLKMFMRSFVFDVGSPTWERTFGKYWDEALEKEKV